MPYPGRILAVDYGSKRVGIAASDPTRLLARGIATIPNDGYLIKKLSVVIREQDAVRVVVGMPYAPDGGKGAKAVEVERFIERLTQAVDVEIDTWDESYSSARARQAFRETGMKRRKRQEKGRVDEMAARLMLQEYLDYHRDTDVCSD